MLTSEDLLERAATDGNFESAEWPRVHGVVLEKIQHNVYNEFQTPAVQKLESAIDDPTDPTSLDSPDTSITAKENALPSSSPPQNKTFSTATEPTTQFSTTEAQSQPALPPRLQSTYDYVKRTLEEHFSAQPPHTIQRLAELVLRPKEHYRFLHQYLNALDRVVSVSSGLDSFPPALDTLNGGAALVNGTTTSPGLGSDESLGGALLTPIPWLRDHASSGSASPTATAHPSNGTTPDAEPDDRMRGAVTQGELLRLAQEHGDPPPPVASAPTAFGSALDEAWEGDGDALEDELPHARGPEMIGLEDTGPRPPGAGQTLDMEAAVGRLQSPPVSGALEDEAGVEKGERERVGEAKQEKDDDGDVVLADADGITEDEERKGEGERREVTLGVDTTAQ